MCRPALGLGFTKKCTYAAGLGLVLDVLLYSTRGSQRPDNGEASRQRGVVDITRTKKADYYYYYISLGL